MCIPKIIHYCWFGGNDFSELNRKCIESWKKNCPDYKIIKWDESNYDIEKNEYLRSASKLKKWAFVSDFARLDVVNEYGGIYLDVDVELLKSFDEFLDCKSFWGIEKVDKECFVNSGLGFVSKKQNVLLLDLMSIYDGYDKEAPFTPCPILQKKVFANLGVGSGNTIQNIDGNLFYPSEYFAPKNYNTGKIKLTDNTVSIHHYASSWVTDSQTEYEKKLKLYSKFFGKRLAEYVISIKNKINNKGG